MAKYGGFHTNEGTRNFKFKMAFSSFEQSTGTLGNMEQMQTKFSHGFFTELFEHNNKLN